MAPGSRVVKAKCGTAYVRYRTAAYTDYSAARIHRQYKFKRRVTGQRRYTEINTRFSAPRESSAMALKAHRMAYNACAEWEGTNAAV